jgi:extracellular elastinolytic metalloproteinase
MKRRLSVFVAAATAVAFALVLAGPAFAVGQTLASHEGLSDFSASKVHIAPTAVQRSAAADLGAAVNWNQYGTPSSVVRPGGYLATGIAAKSAELAARHWLSNNADLFRLGSLDGLRLYSDNMLAFSKAHAVTFQRTYGGLPAVSGTDLVTVAVLRSKGAWKVTFASSSLSGASELVGSADLSPAEAWGKAAGNVGEKTSLLAIHDAADSAGWNNLRVDGLKDAQRVRLGAFATGSGAVPAYDTLVVDSASPVPTAYRIVVDARDGSVLSRTNLVDNLAQGDSFVEEPFSGEVPTGDGACDVKKGPFVVGPNIGAIHGGAGSPSLAAPVPDNDMVILLFHESELVQVSDTFTNPEFFFYGPVGGVPTGNWFVQICDFAGDGVGWVDPRTYTGEFIQEDAVGALARWNAFPANPPLNPLPGYPWNNPSTDTRKQFCWFASASCDIVTGNLASRGPWDFDFIANAPTFTTVGNNNRAATAWTVNNTPSPPAHTATPSPTRDYNYPWTNEWFNTKCAPIPPVGDTGLPPVTSWDADAADTNLFVMHNRMHDFAYYLGFTERNFNSQASNFGNTPPAQEHDPLIGDVQNGVLIPGVRDNANMGTLPDGISSITNMYMWQAFAGSFYAPCVDGDYDMGVIGHEFTHMIENRMIGKGGNRLGFHAGAMGEGVADLTAVEYLIENNFQSGGATNFVEGPYATGNPEHGIRDYDMSFPRTGPFPSPGVYPHVNPLNFSDIGFDTPGNEVHSDGEIWIAANYDVRAALAAKYNASFPSGDTALQAKCAGGVLPPENCPGNRRWMQLLFDSYLLDPVAPSMLDARNSMLAADVTRFGGANQAEIWLAFARRGFGQNAALHSDATLPTFQDTDPVPDFASPLQANATVTFNLKSKDGGGGDVVGNVYVGHYEARVSPIADTNSATSNSGIDVNRDNVAAFAPGTYDFVAVAPGYGFVRFSATLAAGARTINVLMPTNWAAAAQGATATGTGVSPGSAIDETEGTNWRGDGTLSVVGADGRKTISVDGQQVTVDLAGTAPRAINHVQVSAMIAPGNNRFSALRQFEIWACSAAGSNTCTNDADFTKVFTSGVNAFPGDVPRPIAPQMILRDFSIPTTPATHLRLRVLSSQCTGNPAYEGDQDNDPLVNADCNSVTGATTAVPARGFVRAAELQAFMTSATVTGPPAVTPPPPPSPPASPPPPPAPPTAKKTPPKCVVPSVKGKKLAAAKKAIKARRCRVGSIRAKSSRLAAKGRVIAQSPRAGRRVALGTRVNLVVSKGARAVRGARIRFAG